MAVFAVNRDEITGLDHIYQYLELFLIRMPRDMDVFDLLVYYIGPVPAQVVYNVVDGTLVSWNELRGEDYRIPFLNSEFLVIVESHPAQGAHRLALRAGGQHHHL